MQSSERPPRLQSIKTQETDEPSKYVSVKATAVALGVNRRSVYRAFHAGLLPGRRFGRAISIYRPLVAELVQIIDSGQTIDVLEFAATRAATRATETEVA